MRYNAATTEEEITGLQDAIWEWHKHPCYEAWQAIRKLEEELAKAKTENGNKLFYCSCNGPVNQIKEGGEEMTVIIKGNPYTHYEEKRESVTNYMP